MRGLPSKEISSVSWLRALRKESIVGFLNDDAIAKVCSFGVLNCGGSFGWALVTTLGIVSSLCIARGSGALVPMDLNSSDLNPRNSLLLC